MRDRFCKLLAKGFWVMPKHVLDMAQTEADVDWLRARRLKLAADAGDKSAARELKRMQKTKMVKAKPNEG